MSPEKMYEEPQPLSLYLGRELRCSCGRVHRAGVRAVEIGPGALKKLPDYVRKFGYGRPLILCDPVTRQVAGERCLSLLTEAGIETRLHELRHLNYDEATLGEIVCAVTEERDLIVAVGTGSITDITRYASFRLGLPCFTVATGAPMDGFAASIGILNLHGLKATLPAHCTELILGDTDILRTAPARMTAAGFGDLIGKISCLNDWALGRIVNGEHSCENIIRLVQSCVDRTLALAPRLREGDGEALGGVLEGLVLSGTAISLYGSSRPASGAEHHLSHYWETVLPHPAMHGEQVAVGTVLVLLLAEELLKVQPDFDRARAEARAYDPLAWEAGVRRVYGQAAEAVLALERTARKNDRSRRLARLDRTESRWEEICAQLRTLPAAEELIAVLRTAGCPWEPRQIGVDIPVLTDSFRYAKELRERYTLLQTVYDLALTDELTEKVVKRLYG